MSSSIQQKKVNAPDPVKTRTTSFIVVPIMAASEEISIDADDFLFSTKKILWLRDFLSRSSIEVDITSICVMWDPKVEPSCNSSVIIKVFYDHPGDHDHNSDDDNMVSLSSGIISESMMVTVYPTRSLVYPKGGPLKFPWRVKVETSCFSQDDPKYVLGSMKIWCTLNVKLVGNMKSKRAKQYKDPETVWSTTYYPFYIPTRIIKGLRAVKMLDEKETKEYKSYKTIITNHCLSKTYTEEDTWNLMQSMTHQDINNILSIVSLCGAENGGSYCTCGTDVSDLVTIYMRTCHSACHMPHKQMTNIRNSLTRGTTVSISEVDSLLCVRT